MIESRDGYAVDPKRCELHAVIEPYFWGYSVYILDTVSGMKRGDPEPEWYVTKLVAKRAAKKMLHKALHPKPGRVRYSKHGREMVYVYAGEPGNLIGAVRRVRFGYIVERYQRRDRWVPFRWMGLWLAEK